MRIAIVGYGKMGHMVRESALAHGHEVVAVIDPVSSDAEVTAKSVSLSSLGDAECVIDFSHPSCAVNNILFYGGTGISAVIGTTGWYSELESIKAKLSGEKASILYSGNFSVGVLAMVRIVSYASRIFNRLAQYDVALFESHHKEKADSPSGTALMLANEVVRNIDRKTAIDAECQHERIKPEVLQVSSMRCGFNPGFHEVVFDSPEDTVTIEHQARGRKGFAEGAITAAEWLHGKEGIFSMDDCLKDIIGE